MFGPPEPEREGKASVGRCPGHYPGLKRSSIGCLQPGQGRQPTDLEPSQAGAPSVPGTGPLRWAPLRQAPAQGPVQVSELWSLSRGQDPESGCSLPPGPLGAQTKEWKKAPQPQSRSRARARPKASAFAPGRRSCMGRREWGTACQTRAESSGPQATSGLAHGWAEP